MKIRVAREEDGEGVAAIYDPIVQSTAISFETEPPGPAEMSARIRRTLVRWPWLVAEDPQGRVGGYVYAGAHRDRAAYQWSVDVTAYVREDLRGQGLGRQLYTHLFTELRSLGYRQAFAGIALPNAASVALHESLGFSAIGVYRQVGFKLGEWRDVGWWQKSLWTDSLPMDLPTPPRAFDGGQGQH